MALMNEGENLSVIKVSASLSSPQMNLESCLKDYVEQKIAAWQVKGEI